MRRLLPVFIVVQFLFVVSGCSHTVSIDTEPSGGDIRVNGERLGKGPVTYTETTGWEKVYEVEATKPGYTKVRRTMKQTDWNMPVAAASAFGGTFLCFPFGYAGFLFARQLPDRVVIPLEKRGSGGGDTSAPVEDYGY